jgi:hypothetical protein
MARCVKVDDHEDYHHHCYGDYYVSVSVDPFEYGHSSLLFLEVLWFWILWLLRLLLLVALCLATN